MSKEKFKDKHDEHKEYLMVKIRMLEYELSAVRQALKYWKERGWRKGWEKHNEDTQDA